MKKLSLMLVTIFIAALTGCELGMTDYYDDLTQPTAYTVIYNANGAESGMVPVDYTEYKDEDTVTVKGDDGNLTKSGASFCGWDYQAPGGTRYTQGDTFIIGKEQVTLYARWTTNSVYHIYYNVNGGSGSVPVDNTGYETGWEVVIPGPGSITRSGYSFTGWNTAANGSGSNYTQGTLYTMGSANVTLYANWDSGLTYSVIYSPTNPETDFNITGNVPVDNTYYRNGATVTVLGNTGLPSGLTHPHYSLTGWNTLFNGSGTTYVFGGTFSMPENNVLLYAKWTAKNYNLAFNRNGGTGTMTSQSIAYKATAAIKANTFTRTGYSFAGWATTSGGAVAYANQANYTMNTNGATLYAKWNTYDRNWKSIAISSDGTRIAAAASGGYIWTSTDSGLTWTERTGAGSRNWYSIASSSDGTRLVAGVFNGYIYTSADSGATWTERTPGGTNRLWFSIASSSDGTKIAAASQAYITTSGNSGVDWTDRRSGTYWGISSSSDGTKLAAAIFMGYIYTSTDSGASWTERQGAGSRHWHSIASSSDGTRLAACVFESNTNQYIYTSTDSGASWTERQGAGGRVWASIASSSDGTKLAAVASGGYIYTSANGGANWTERTGAGSRNWCSIASSSDPSSSDGTRLAVVDENGGIWISTDSGATWTRRL